MALMDLYGIHVEVSPFAMDKILTSGQEGVKYPQAIAETFAFFFAKTFEEKKISTKITIECDRKNLIFSPVINEEEFVIITSFALVNGNGDEVQGAPEPYRVYTNYTDLCQVRYTRRSYGFNAAQTAQEYAKNFAMYYKDFLL